MLLGRTIVRTFIPDPPPSEHSQAPPTHAGSNLPADEPVWGAARRSYIEGCCTPVVAERHGLNERTVRRRAAQENWPQMRLAARGPTPADFKTALLGAGAAPWTGDPVSAEAEMERDPQLEQFVSAHGYEVGELLLNPQPQRLSRFAFRRSAEAAASGAAAEALSWMRLVQAIDRVHVRLERAALPFSEADYLRAHYATQLRERFGDEPYGEDGPQDEATTVGAQPPLSAKEGEVSGCPDVRRFTEADRLTSKIQRSG